MSGAWEYKPLNQLNQDQKEETSQHGQFGLKRTQVSRKRQRTCLLTVVCLALLSALLLLPWSNLSKASSKNEGKLKCTQPSIRREWRFLRPSEQRQYLEAVRCLMDKESKQQPGTSRYDDFAYGHVHEGTLTHYAAAFLPWHRYFIHVFEKALREECNFMGSLPFWNWELDAADLNSSPIWDIQRGFGGDGEKHHDANTRGPFAGNCVFDGPFANTTRTWLSKANGHGFDINHSPHCLSRGFESGERKKELEDRITPEAISEVLEQRSYDAFLEKLEVKSHNSIPQFVRGDFFALTAPNGRDYRPSHKDETESELTPRRSSVLPAPLPSGPSVVEVAADGSLNSRTSVSGP